MMFTIIRDAQGYYELPDGTWVRLGPDQRHCPNPQHMGEYACANRHQCWEPCGDLGKSEEHAVVVDEPKGE